MPRTAEPTPKAATKRKAKQLTSVPTHRLLLSHRPAEYCRHYPEVAQKVRRPGVTTTLRQLPSRMLPQTPAQLRMLLPPPLPTLPQPPPRRRMLLPPPPPLPPTLPAAAAAATTAMGVHPSPMGTLILSPARGWAFNNRSSGRPTPRRRVLRRCRRRPASSSCCSSPRSDPVRRRGCQPRATSFRGTTLDRLPSCSSGGG